jgi:undecaprenyl-diphosphatase
LGLLWGLVLGVIQGATEFLPVSSSAHLAFAGALAGISEKDALPFFLVLHFGTLAALAAYFAGDLLGLAKGCLRLDRTAWRLVLMIALTSLPTGIIGLALKDIVEKAFVSTAWPAAFLVVTAAALFFTKFGSKGESGLGGISPVSALLIGLAQGLAVLPGISRSGSTIAAGLLCGLKRDDAFRYSFLSSIPAIGGAFLLDMKGIADTASNFGTGVMIVSFFLAAVSGFASLFFLKRAVTGGRLHLFSYYCLFASACGFLITYFVP